MTRARSAALQKRAPKSPPPVPAAARKGGSGVHRRPAPPPPKKAPPSKLGGTLPLPQAKLPPRPVVALRALPPPARRDLLRDHPPANHDEDEDTVVEMAGEDPFDTFYLAAEPPPLSAPSLPTELVRERAHDLLYRVLDVLDGARGCFDAHRDARVLTALTAGTTLTLLLPVMLFLVAISSASPGATAPAKHTSSKLIPVLVPLMIEVPAAAPAEPVPEEVSAPDRSARRARARRARLLRARRAQRSPRST